MSSVLTRETVVNSQPPAPRLPASLPGRIALEVKRTWCAWRSMEGASHSALLAADNTDINPIKIRVIRG